MIISRNPILRYDISSYFDSSALNREPKISKEITHDSHIKAFTMIGPNIVVQDLNKEINIINTSTNRKRNIPLNKSKINDIFMSSLNSNEILLMYDYGEGSYCSLWIDINGGIKNDRNPITIEAPKIFKIISNKHFLLITTPIGTQVFTINDLIFCQTIHLSDESLETSFEFVNSNLFAMAEKFLFLFDKLNPEQIYNQASSSLDFRIGVGLLKSVEEDEQYVKNLIPKLYNYCGWQMVQKNKYDLATECFLCVNFDPAEIVELIVPKYNLNIPFEVGQYASQIENFVRQIFKKRREDLSIQSDKQFYDPSEILRKNKSDEKGRIDVWMPIIDYVILRTSIELGKHVDLFEFLRSISTVQCIKKKEVMVSLLNYIPKKISHSRNNFPNLPP